MKDEKEFLNLINELKERFKDSIRNFDYSSTLKEYKAVYLPIK